MFERFRKKKQPEGQAVEPDGIPKHIMPNREHIIKLGYSESLQYFEGFLEGLSRTELMDFQDSKQFDGTAVEEAAWESANNEEWKREYPMGKHTYTECIPDIVKDTISDYKLSDMTKQVAGIQKKLDRMAKLIENTEVTMSGKTALKM